MLRRLATAATSACLLACADVAEKDGAIEKAGSVAGGVDLNGAGATFPLPIYSKWFSVYSGETGVRINYGSVGSGAGIRQLSEMTVDFGATDIPMSDEELAGARGGPILHFPSVLGAVVVTYNLPELQAPLRLTGGLIADIFLGRITRWNDPRIAAENIGTPLPAKDILVMHRSDGSGTTFIFTDYLATVSAAWRGGPGKGRSVPWPVGLGGRGNEGVAGSVKQTPGALGYVELAYARQNRLPIAHLRNAEGNVVAPTTQSITAAAEGAAAWVGADSDYRVSLVNAPGAEAYPISSFTWLLVYATQADAVKGRKLVEFMRWMYKDGQRMAADLDYAPLPPALAAQLTDRLARIAGTGQ